MEQINKVLLVDDDDVTNMMHTRIINKSNRVGEVLVAKDGREALDVLQAHIDADEVLPELIFLDINMPGMGGFEFLEEYAKRGLGRCGQMIIVMLSTSLLKADHDRAEADPNVYAFAGKPIRSDHFLELIEAYIAKHSKAAQ
jgi:CheY-like chemotaxis protein